MNTINGISTHYSPEEQNILARFATRNRRTARCSIPSPDQGVFQVLAVL